MRLENKLAVITAAASGMGRAAVERFASEGARVAAIDIDEANLASLKSDLAAKGHEIKLRQNLAGSTFCGHMPAFPGLRASKMST